MAGAHGAISAIPNKERRAGVLQGAGIQMGAQHSYERDYQPDRERVAQRDRRQGGEHSSAPALLQTQADSEKPAHPGIDPMERSQSQEHEPRPEIRHLMCLDGLRGTVGSRLFLLGKTIGIRGGVTAFQPNLMQPMFLRLEEEFGIELNPAVRFGVELHHPVTHAIRIELFVPGSVK
jgi:hypothetical protein